MSSSTFPQFPMFPFPTASSSQDALKEPFATTGGFAPMVELCMLASNDITKLQVEWWTALASCRTPIEVANVNARFLEQSYRLALNTANRAAETARDGAQALEARVPTAE